MRLDPSQINAAMGHLSGGAVDAVEGEKIERLAADAEKESQFESLDSLLLRRMRAATLSDAAASVVSLSDARRSVDQARELMAQDPDGARAAQSELARDRLRDLLGGS